MSKRRHRAPVRIKVLLNRAHTTLAGQFRCLCHALRQKHRHIPLEILIADRRHRASLERDLNQSIRQLRRVLGAHLPPDVAIVVQQIIQTDRQLAGCYQVSQRPDGTRFALVRLALQVDRRPLDIDEILAALAEQVIGLAVQSGGTAVLVPFDFSPSSLNPRQSTPLNRADPLAARSNGKAPTGPNGSPDFAQS